MENGPVNAAFFRFGFLVFISLLVGSIVSSIGLPRVIGYLITGIAMGPSGLGIVTDQTLIDYLSELGVLLLLFYMGLEISFKKFSRAGAYALFLSPVKSGIGFALGFLAARLMGLPTLLGIVFGASLAVSSTAIISQIILEKHWQSALEAQIAMAMLILEDIFSVFVIGYLLGGEGGISVGKILLNSFVVLFILFVIGSRLSKKLLHFVMVYGKPEHFSLYAFALLLLFAYGVSYVGMSPLLGAFFVGMLLSETVHAKRIEEELAGFRKLFVVIFFTALGLKYSITFGPLAVKLFLAGLGIILLQRIALFLFGPLFGLEPRRSAKLAIIMFPLGEFSLFTAAAVQAINFSDPHILNYFGLTSTQAAAIPAAASELMGATFALIVLSTAISGLIFRREEDIESILLRIVPDSVFRFAERLSPYFRLFPSVQGRATSPAFTLLVEKKTQRIVEYAMAIVAVTYLMGYAASEYPHLALPIYVIGYLLAASPLAGIVMAIYAVMTKYAEEFTAFSGFPRDFNRKIARGMASVFVGVVLFVFAIISLAVAEGQDVLTFHLLSILLVAASVGLAAYGVYELLFMFLQPLPPPSSRTTRRGMSGRR